MPARAVVLLLLAEAQAFALDASGSFRRTRVPVGEHDARVLEVFPAQENCGMVHNSKKRVSSVCGGIPRYPPPLVSMSNEKVTEYKRAMCNTNSSTEFAQEDLTVTVTKVSGGETCVYIPSSRVGLSTHREVWNSTHTMLLGDRNGKDFLSSKSRERAASSDRKHVDIDEDIMIVPFAHSNSVYTHALLDFLPHAYATVDWVKAKNLKILTGSSLQRRLLLATGLDRDFVATPSASEDQLLCVRKGRSIHVMETTVKDSNEYPVDPEPPRGRPASGCRHGQRGRRVAPPRLAEGAGGGVPGALQRDLDHRPMDNEDDAFRLVQSTMKQKDGGRRSS
ncbi:unnamed protein product [Prorocentrum cordatum]|uniref:Uncharacterized protein n=1 Tax=Prorocentrum cordatum TaxID=2364126 RepID=A0ABN9R0V0_9DINO|nr:unnamed protein product [Polarella glacialis]